MDWKIKAVAAFCVLVIAIAYAMGAIDEKPLQSGIAILLSILAANQAHAEFKMSRK